MTAHALRSVQGPAEKSRQIATIRSGSPTFRVVCDVGVYLGLTPATLSIRGDRSNRAYFKAS